MHIHVSEATTATNDFMQVEVFFKCLYQGVIPCQMDMPSVPHLPAEVEIMSTYQYLLILS